MSRRRAVAIGVVALLMSALLSGCDSEQDRRETSAVRPHLNVLAAKISELPSVTCTIGLLPDGGTGGDSPTDIRMALTLDLPLGDPAIPDVLKAAGEVVWGSDLPVEALTIDAYNGTVTLTRQVRGTGDSFGSLTVDELKALYGPRPSPPASLAPVEDPGRQTC